MPPPISTDLVTRPRLMERLADGLRCKLTLISAPAGSGKSTLLRQWITSSGYPTAWVSLDASDNDPSQFWSYVFAATQAVNEEVSHVGMTILRSSLSPNMKSALVTLINVLVELQVDLNIAFDDYHVIDSQQVHDDMEFLLDHLPPRVHLVIASRSDPPLPLARLRARGQLTELRFADLSFTYDETNNLLNEVMGLQLAEEHVAALTDRTEGWVAGLQLASLSLQGVKDVSEFIETFAGGHQHISDYLMEEVFGRQSERIQRFLLCTSIVDRISGSLADAITGSAESQAVLEGLQKANLFTLPLDNERYQYRYHHVFAHFLQSRLERLQPDFVRELHRRASGWYAANGQTVEAAEHALAAGEFELAARLINEIAWATLKRGAFMTFRSWIERLPDYIMRSQPRLCLYDAWVLAMTDRLDDAAARLLDIERFFGTAVDDKNNAAKTFSDMDVVEMERILDQTKVVRAYIAGNLGNSTLAIELSQQALEKLPEDDTLRSTATLVLGRAFWRSGDAQAAISVIGQGSFLGRLEGHVHNSVGALSHLAGTHAVQGHLIQAAQTYQQALRIAAEHKDLLFSTLPSPYIGFARLMYEWNDLRTASVYAEQGIEFSKHNQLYEMLAYEVLARVKQAQNDFEGALTALDRAECLGSPRKDDERASRRSEYRARVRLAQRDLNAAIQWSQAIEARKDDELSQLNAGENFTLARIWMAQGRHSEAMELLQRLLRSAEKAEQTGNVIKILALRALVLDAIGHTAEALESLVRALSLAEPEGYVRTFVDLGARMCDLLQRLHEAPLKNRLLEPHHVSHGYVMKLLAVLTADSGKFSRLPQPLADPLSMRELEVLNLISTGAPNADIARVLVIQPSTVKKHINSIFSKLGVRSRAQAIVRTRELNLLSWRSS